MYRRVGLFLILILTLTMSAHALDNYKKFDRSLLADNYIEVSFKNEQVSLTIYRANTTDTIVFNTDETAMSNDQVTVRNQPILDKNGFILDSQSYGVDLIDDIKVLSDDGKTEIYFRKKSDKTSSRYRDRKSNRISVFDTIYVAGKDFVRGSVVGFWTDIRIDGEVNEDVIALFGNVVVGSKAVVRGDIVALDGQVTIEPEATLYGEILSSDYRGKSRFSRSLRWSDDEMGFSPLFRFYYNRVDGATPLLGVHFNDIDSILPRVEIYAGYGFSSEHLRYSVGAEQTLFLPRPLTFGASFYKKLSSDDDWLISEFHNTLFALLATEDYRDFYESEGGYGFVKYSPVENLDAEAGLRLEKTNWLVAHRDLWSMFGGSKRFPRNFASVADPDRTLLINEMDKSETAALSASVSYDDSRKTERYGYSFWKGSANIEWLPDGWNDDFVFTRYKISAGRYQKFNKFTGGYIGLTYGNSSGNLPIYKYFYLGGINTLLGYKHKEFRGEQFWMGDMEYSIKFPRTDVTGWFFYNVGQMAAESGDLGEAEVKNSIGIGISLNDNIRADLAKRLDKSESSFKLHVRLGFTF